MKRSTFLRLTFSFAMTSGFGLLPLLDLSKKVTRKVTFYFPEGKTFEDFKKDRTRWMNPEKSINFLKECRSNGTIKDFKTNIYPDRVEYIYVFNSKQDHDNFVAASEKISDLNRRTRNFLGYKADLEIA